MPCAMDSDIHAGMPIIYEQVTMTTKHFKSPIPKGFCILEGGVRVAGTHVAKHQQAVAAFFHGGGKDVILVREPLNPHDSNAIKVVGTFRKLLFLRGSATLGYVPRELAEAIASLKLEDEVIPRLASVTVDAPDYYEVVIDLICQKVSKERFQRYFTEKLVHGPASEEQLEFSKFFKIKFPRGISYGEAQAVVGKVKRELDEAQLSKFNQYFYLWAEFSDVENTKELYSLKKVSRKRFDEAVDHLLANGESMASLENDPNLIADYLLDKYPTLDCE